MNAFEKLSADIKRIFRLVGYSGGAVAAFILLIVSLLLVQLPPWLLDILLVINVLLSLTVLLRAVFSDSALKMYSFPAIIVLATLFRLALNVSSTKLILLDGHLGLDAAGRVIESFGSFVVRGDFWVGVIVFGIIAVVNFVVIAKGSARVAEVAARFTLDALPGKQLAIDADLRSGIISSDESMLRRAELAQESQFYGAMDGAMKWVQGDAVACIVIAIINAIGGITLGVYRGLNFEDAVRSFGVLTIGDGLVSILPSLLISVAAGIVVTQSGVRGTKGVSEQVVAHLFGESKAPIVAAASLLAVGFLSLAGLIDFPFAPFILVGGVFAGLVLRYGLAAESDLRADVRSQRLSAVDLYDGAGAKPLGATAKPARSEETAIIDQLQLEVDPRVLGSYLGLRSATNSGNEDRQAEFYRLADAAWQQNYKERGVLLPPVSLAAARDLTPGGYRVLVRERAVRSGILRVDQVLASTNASLLKVLGITATGEVKHPVSNRAACWIDIRRNNLNSLRHLGVELYNPANFLIQECIGAVYEVIEEIFGLAEAKTLLEAVRAHHSGLASEIFDSAVLTLPEFAELLRRLVRERVSIRDLKLILEGTAEYKANNPDVEDRQEWLDGLHSFLRVVLSRGIIDDVLGPGDRFRTFALSAEIEDEFRTAVSMWEGRRTRPPLDPEFESNFRNRALKFFNPLLERGAVPIVVLCSPDIRHAVSEFFGRELGSGEWLRTLCYQELSGQYRPESVGILRV